MTLDALKDGLIAACGEAVASDAALSKWIAMAMELNRSLPEKTAGRK